MEQYKKIVVEAPEGMRYTTSQGENGELIVRLLPKSSETTQGSNISSQSGGTCFYPEAIEGTERDTGKSTYFTKISAEDREKVKKWLAKQKGKTKAEKEFFAIVEEAMQVVDYDYWIANLEPSVEDGKIYYAKGKDVGVGFSAKQWEEKSKEYAPERASRLSTLYELFIWYALRIANGWWSLDYVACDSSSAGNYKNSPNTSQRRERTGTRECGGYADGQGNTCKIVTYKRGFVIVGGAYFYSGDHFPVAFFSCCNNPDDPRNNSSGVLVLTK